ncbi:hypothetical protein WN944_026838 [Citrus x changshan-huyou]|uniref:Uncharacterized protein n=1 Tax=Citrus x changshan-huyou TaxID=2935761 RepID=A0AAP0LKR0_9ROSI
MRNFNDDPYSFTNSHMFHWNSILRRITQNSIKYIISMKYMNMHMKPTFIEMFH